MTDASAPVDANGLWVSLAEAAAHQKVSRQAVHKRVSQLVEAGKLSTRPGPRGTRLVNLALYLRAVREETDPAQYLRNRTDAPLLEPDEDDEPERAAPEPGRDGKAGGKSTGATYHDARAQREAFNAENARLDLEERLGRLIDKADVEASTMTVFRRLRDRLLSIPSTLADRLAAQPDARAVRVLLDTELRTMLETLATELDDLGEDEPGYDA